MFRWHQAVCRVAGTALEAAASDKKDKTMGSGGTLRHSRRQLLQEMAAAGVGLAVMPVLPAGASTDEQAIYFTWGGYDDENMQVKYTEQFGEPPVRVTYGDAEEGLQKLRAGFVADVMHPARATCRAGGMRACCSRSTRAG